MLFDHKFASFAESPAFDRAPEVTHLKARLTHFYLVIPYKDPLSAANVPSDLSAAVDSIRKWSDDFFDLAKQLPQLSSTTSLDSIRLNCDQLFGNDQLRYVVYRIAIIYIFDFRFVGCPLVFDYTIERNMQDGESISLSISAINCQLLECLSSSSTGDTMHQMTHIELLKFVNQNDDHETMSNIVLQLTNKDNSPV